MTATELMVALAAVVSAVAWPAAVLAIALVLRPRPRAPRDPLIVAMETAQWIAITGDQRALDRYVSAVNARLSSQNPR